MAQCVQCGHELITGARYCTACGAIQLAAPCPSCGIEARPGARFCAACGSPMHGASGTLPAATGRLGDAAAAAGPPARDDSRTLQGWRFWLHQAFEEVLKAEAGQEVLSDRGVRIYPQLIFLFAGDVEERCEALVSIERGAKSAQ